MSVLTPGPVLSLLTEQSLVYFTVHNTLYHRLTDNPRYTEFGVPRIIP